MSSPLPSLLECYWVLPGQLLAGEFPAHQGTPEAARRLDALLDAGIDTFFDLTEPDELSSYLPMLKHQAEDRGIGISYQRFPILDLGLPQPRQMQLILDCIDQALAQGHRVYLHCWGGVGRTGMTVGCFLVRHGRTGEEALHQIAEWWRAMPKRRYSPRSPETPEQVQFVLSWQEPFYAGTE